MNDVLTANQKLLNAIANRDWDGYVDLCDPALTCFEPESRGTLIEGLEFHKFYFDGPEQNKRCQSSMVAPKVAELSENVVLLTYVRVVQTVDASGNYDSAAFEETRIWKDSGSGWKLIHFHRSASEAG